MLVCEDIFLKREVVLMEDNLRTQQAIKEVIEDELNWKVNIVNSKDEAINKAKTKDVAYYILDAHMGISREQEGLDTLEVIKQVDSNAFVSIFSAYPNNERRAKNLYADIFIKKTANIKEDVRQKLAPVILKQRLICLELQKEDTRDQLDKLIKDPNINAYERLKLDPKKFSRYKNQYVVFVNGKLVDNDTNKQDLFKRIREKYPNESRFFKKVEKQNRIVDMPSYDIL